MISESDWQKLHRLGMTKAWLELGIVSSEWLQQACDEGDAGQEPENTEHIRFGRLKSFLEQTPSWPHDLFRGLLDILWDDPDRVMATAVLRMLADHPGLYEYQLTTVRDIAPAGIRMAVERRWRLEWLEREGVTDDLVEEAVEIGDAGFQKAILDRPDLTTSAAMKLADSGATVAVRNRAKQMQAAVKNREDSKRASNSEEAQAAIDLQKYSDLCCEEMRRHLTEGEVAIEYSERLRRYGIRVLDGGSSIQTIRYCPWCGGELPPSLSDEYFDRIEALGCEYPHEAPEPFQSDAWWKAEGL